MDAVGSGNKRPTEKSEQKTKEKQHTVSRILPVRMLFRYSIGGIFFDSLMKRAGGKLRSLQKNQSVFSATCQYPPLSGPIRRSTPSAFSPAICFSTALGLIPIRLASAVALSVLSCESRAMIFSLLFEFILLLSIVNDIQKFVCKFDVCNFYNTIFFCWIIKNIDADISNGRYSQAARL